MVLCSWITALHHRDEVTFDSILPPEADCFTAAQTLYELLGEEAACSLSTEEVIQNDLLAALLSAELLSDKKLTACQTEPYGDIIIRPRGGLKMAA